MPQRIKRKCVMLIIPSKGFSAFEYNTTKNTLEKMGIEVFTASDTALDAIGDDGSAVMVDADLAIIDVGKYDGLFLIGGPGTLSCLNTPLMYQLVKDACDMDVPYGAIDLAVRVLAYANCLMGKQATGLDDDRALNSILETHGARYRATDVVVDYHVVTASRSADSQKFVDAILEVLRKKEINAPKKLPQKRE